jgi:hypothetical protein
MRGDVDVNKVRMELLIIIMMPPRNSMYLRAYVWNELVYSLRDSVWKSGNYCLLYKHTK